MYDLKTLYVFSFKEEIKQELSTIKFLLLNCSFLRNPLPFPG